MKVSQILDTRRANKAGLYPVCVRVSHDKKADLFQTGEYVSKEQFPFHAEHPLLNRVRKITGSLTTYSAAAVRTILETRDTATPLTNNIFDWFKYKAEECIATNESYGNANEYTSASKFYHKYFDKDVVPFELVTVAKLFEIQRTKSGDYALSTIGKYARHLRSVFNMAITAGFIDQSLYPFGKYKYIPPKSRKRKKALPREDMQALLHYTPETPREQFHLDLFFFSFYANGLNLKDVAMLRFKDMGTHHIIKLREKTMYSSSQEPIKIYLIQELRDIIHRQCNLDTSLNNYIFPLLKLTWTSEQVFLELNKLRSRIQRTLSSIGKKLGITVSLPHGTSRHCFATAMKQGGASTELISETIGHSSAEVTKHYQSDFEQEEGITYQAHLIAYTKK